MYNKGLKNVYGQTNIFHKKVKTDRDTLQL